MTTLIVFFLCYTILLISILGIGMWLQAKKERNYEIGRKINCSEITLIIPFRNEEKRISGFLNSIQNSKKLPNKILFVNDHSDDNGPNLIHEILQGIEFEILNLPDGSEGKKQAIRYAIREINSKYVLTMDADVVFAPTYFEEIEKLAHADMYLLPAVMMANKPIHYFFEIDLLLINALNTGINGLIRPIIASGANLLFNRESFQKFDQIDRHAHIPSGDDIYLLRDFREANCDIRLVAKSNLQVQTETPQTFKEFLHQRVRWIAKTGNVKDHLSTSLAILQLILLMVFWIAEIKLLLDHKFLLASVIFGCKTSIDMLLFFPFFKEFQRLKSWILIPIYQVIFPFYNLILLGIMPFFTPLWKGRKSTINVR